MFTAIQNKEHQKSQCGRSDALDDIQGKDPEMVTEDKLALDDCDNLKVIQDMGKASPPMRFEPATYV
jgi:hypothetical protein